MPTLYECSARARIYRFQAGVAKEVSCCAFYRDERRRVSSGGLCYFCGAGQVGVIN